MVQKDNLSNLPRFERRMQVLRFPILFGSILGIFIVGFSCRKYFFAEDVEAERRKKHEQGREADVILQQAKLEILAKKKSKS